MLAALLGILLLLGALLYGMGVFGNLLTANGGNVNGPFLNVESSGVVQPETNGNAGLIIAPPVVD